MAKNKKQKKPTGNSEKRNLLFGGFLLASLALPILVSSSEAIDPTYLIRHLVLSLVLGGAFLFMVVTSERSQIASGLIRIVKTPLSLALLAFLVVKLASISVAINKLEAVFDGLSYLIGFVFFLVSSVLIAREKKPWKTVSQVAMVLNAVLLLFAGWEFLKVGFNWQEMGEVGSVMVNQNMFAPMFLLCIPLVLLGRHEIDKTSWLALVLVGLSVLVIVALQNRATYLALMAGILVYGAVLIFLMNKGLVFKLTFVGVLLTIIGFGTSQILKHADYLEVLTNREATIHERYNSVTERLQLWNRSALLFVDNPILGIGAGNWPLRVGEYGITDPISDKSNKYFLRPHNELLKTASELGIIGMLVLLAVIGLAVRQSIMMTRNENTRQAGALLLSGLAAFAVVSLLSFPLERVPLFVLVMLLLALLNSYGIQNEESKQEGKGRLLVIGLLVSVGLGYAYFQRWESDKLAKNMDDARNRKQWSRVSKLYQELNSTWYNVNYFRVPIDFYSGLAAYHSGQLEVAKKRFRNALECNPNHILTLANLGTCNQQLNDSQSAIEQYERALTVNPNFETARVNLAIAHYKLGNHEQALIEIQQCKNPPANLVAAIERALQR